MQTVVTITCITLHGVGGGNTVVVDALWCTGLPAGSSCCVRCAILGMRTRGLVGLACLQTHTCMQLTAHVENCAYGVCWLPRPTANRRWQHLPGVRHQPPAGQHHHNAGHPTRDAGRNQPPDLLRPGVRRRRRLLRLCVQRNAVPPVRAVRHHRLRLRAAGIRLDNSILARRQCRRRLRQHPGASCLRGSSPW